MQDDAKLLTVGADEIYSAADNYATLQRPLFGRAVRLSGV